MSALPPLADIRQRIEHVCFVPIADIVDPSKACIIALSAIRCGDLGIETHYLDDMTNLDDMKRALKARARRSEARHSDRTACQASRKPVLHHPSLTRRALIASSSGMPLPDSSTRQRIYLAITGSGDAILCI